MGMSIGDKIAAIRDIMDISQRELAAKMGIDPVVLNRIERGKRPLRADELQTISKIFGMSMDEIASDSNLSVPRKDDAYPSLPSLSDHDEKQISRDLKNMLKSLNASASLGTVEDAEDRIMLRSALEQAMRLSKRIAKRKFAPKKKREG